MMSDSLPGLGCMCACFGGAGVGWWFLAGELCNLVFEDADYGNSLHFKAGRVTA